jgi:hypothetical protein
LLIPRHADTIPENPRGTNEKLGAFEVGDLLKVLAVAGKKRQVMRKTHGGNEDVKIPDLLSDLPGEGAPDLGKPSMIASVSGRMALPFRKTIRREFSIRQHA